MCDLWQFYKCFQVFILCAVLVETRACMTTLGENTSTMCYLSKDEESSTCFLLGTLFFCVSEI